MHRLSDSHAGQPSVRPPSDRAHVLLEINNAIVSHLDLAQVLNAVSDCLRREIKHDFAGLALYDAENNHLRVHALDFPVDQKFYEKGQTIPLEGTPAGLAFTSRKPVLRQRIDVNEFPADMVKHAVAKGLRSGCAVPLVCHDRVVGSMALASVSEGAFTEADAELLTQIGGQVAIAVENALHFEQTRRAQRQVAQERDRSRLLLEVNNAVISHLNLQDLLKSFTASLRGVMQHRHDRRGDASRPPHARRSLQPRSTRSCGTPDQTGRCPRHPPRKLQRLGRRWRAPDLTSGQTVRKPRH